MSHEAEIHARNVISTSPIHEIRELSLEITPGELCLYGTLTSYYYKQLAQETLRRICHETKTVLKNLTNVTKKNEEKATETVE